MKKSELDSLAIMLHNLTQDIELRQPLGIRALASLDQARFTRLR